MRRSAIGLIALLALAGATSPAFAQKKPLEDIGDDDDSSSRGPSGRMSSGIFGLGLVLGEPSGLTAKFLFARYNGIQLHLGYGLGKRGRFVLVADYLFHFVDIIPPVARAGRLAPYLGVGGRLGIRSEDPVLGVRIPLGLSFMINGAPIEIFLEFAVGIGIIPETTEIFDGGLGGRFYF